MISRFTVLFGRAKHVLQTEGLVPLLRRGYAFLLGYFLRYENYYLYEYRLDERSEADFMPSNQDFTFKIVSTKEQADGLVADGFEFRSSDGSQIERLGKGAIAVCVFVGRELAHIGWVAMNEEAKKSIIDIPFQVDFPDNKAFAGGVWTNPKYRRIGFHTYSFFKRLQFLKERGIIVAQGVVATSNIAPQRVNAKFNSKIYAEARYLKILWWKSWKEKPLTESSSVPQRT